MNAGLTVAEADALVLESLCLAQPLQHRVRATRGNPPVDPPAKPPRQGPPIITSQSRNYIRDLYRTYYYNLHYLFPPATVHIQQRFTVRRRGVIRRRFPFHW